jgi:hypothetical protein
MALVVMGKRRLPLDEANITAQARGCVWKNGGVILAVSNQSKRYVCLLRFIFSAHKSKEMLLLVAVRTDFMI